MRAVQFVRLELARRKTSRAWADHIIRVDWPPSGEREAQTDSYIHDITNTSHINLTHTSLTTVSNNTHTFTYDS